MLTQRSAKIITLGGRCAGSVEPTGALEHVWAFGFTKPGCASVFICCPVCTICQSLPKLSCFKTVGPKTTVIACLSRMPCAFVVAWAVASRWRPGSGCIANSNFRQTCIAEHERLVISDKALSRVVFFDHRVTNSRFTDLSKIIPQPTRTFGGLPHPERIPAQVEKQA